MSTLRRARSGWRGSSTSKIMAQEGSERRPRFFTQRCRSNTCGWCPQDLCISAVTARDRTHGFHHHHLAMHAVTGWCDVHATTDKDQIFAFVTSQRFNSREAMRDGSRSRSRPLACVRVSIQLLKTRLRLFTRVDPVMFSNCVHRLHNTSPR